jgi:hypothetical protein
MKTAVRNLIGDLVEKRLWPVAVALIVAIVAVPLLLARGSAPESAPTGDIGAAPQTGQDAAVRLVEPATAARERAGSVRNPFGAASDASSGPTTTTTTSASATAASGSTASTSPATSAAGTSSSAAAGSGGGSTTVPTTTTPATSAPSTTSSTATGTTTSTTTTGTTTAKTRASATYSVAVRFGRTDGTRHTMRDVARLTALPNAEAPVVSLLGVLRDGHTAVLEVAANATASGSGTCKPSASSCTTVEMKAGDAEYLSVTRDGGAAPVAWYYLKLLHVDRHETTSKAAARAAYARRSSAGMAVVRRDAAAVRAYRYLPGAGVLVRAAHRSGSAAKAANAGVAPLLPADRQHGLPVWRSVPRSARR